MGRASGKVCGSLKEQVILWEAGEQPNQLDLFKEAIIVIIINWWDLLLPKSIMYSQAQSKLMNSFKQWWWIQNI